MTLAALLPRGRFADEPERLTVTSVHLEQGGLAVQQPRTVWAWFAVAMTAGVFVCTVSCGRSGPQTNGYDPRAVPGITREQLVNVVGKPQSAGTISLPGTSVHADVLTYPFGQVLLQNGRVVAVSINNDPSFRAPNGVTIGMAESDLRTTLAAHGGPHSGHIESYDAISGQIDTKTKDIYDDSDHMMIELVASNPNDPLAPFSVAEVTLTNHAGMLLVDAFTKARVGGLYPDVHVDNFISNSWKVGR